MSSLLRLALLLALVSCTSAPPTPCTDCGGKCVDIMADSANCGACNKACSAGSVCRGGQCALSCASPLLTCSGKCVDAQNDSANCGACGNACTSTQACRSGMCETICAAGTTACTPASAAPYCANLASDNANCGTCGTVCPTGRTCGGGSCIVSCQSPMLLCGTPDAGVCTVTSSDTQNCGTCGVQCAPTQSCLRGACVAALPSSCEEYQRLFPQTPDSEVTLYFRGDPLHPYRATCTEMATSTPLTFLSVAGLDGGSTFSRYDNRTNGLMPCVPQPSPDVITTWNKVRINPANGTVVLSDFTYSSSVGTNVGNTGSVSISRMEFATAGDCACGRPGPACGPRGGSTRWGTAQIDLRNTAFGVDPTTNWLFPGAGSSGSFTLAPDTRLLNVTAGGCCGAGEPQHPSFGRTVQLKYAGRTCAAIRRERPDAGSGVYSLSDGTGPGATEGPFMYCDMVRDNGGWSLVAKVDGTSALSRFAYDSPLWTDSALLGPAMPDESRQEAKYAAFGASSFTEVRVISDNPTGSRTLILGFPQQDSLRDTLARGTGTATTTPRGAAAWTALADGGTLQSSCNAEGLNMRDPAGYGARARIGIVANGEPDCLSPDSVAGVGVAVHRVGGPPAVCSLLPDGGPFPIPTAGAHGAITCFPGTANGSFFGTVWVR